MPNDLHFEDVLYIHSRCCNAHWEVIYCKKTGKYRMLCEKCGKPNNLIITGKAIDSCEKCKTTDIKD